MLSGTGIRSSSVPIIQRLGEFSCRKYGNGSNPDGPADASRREISSFDDWPSSPRARRSYRFVRRSVTGVELASAMNATLPLIVAAFGAIHPAWLAPMRPIWSFRRSDLDARAATAPATSAD